jgi:hypothetical protein
MRWRKTLPAFASPELRIGSLRKIRRRSQPVCWSFWRGLITDLTLDIEQRIDVKAVIGVVYHTYAPDKDIGSIYDGLVMEPIVDI